MRFFRAHSKHYLCSDLAERIQANLVNNLEKGKYTGISSPEKLDHNI